MRPGRSVVGLAVALLLAAGIVTPRGMAPGAVAQDGDAEATIAALQTEVAGLRTPEAAGREQTPAPGVGVRTRDDGDMTPTAERRPPPAARCGAGGKEQ